MERFADRGHSGAYVGPYPLADTEFNLLRQLVREQTGIALGPHKREMLRARLSRRLRALKLSGFPEYCQLLLLPGGEMGHMINAVTTNVTAFFREPHHFRYLANEWLPRRREAATRADGRHLRVWSAGCSTGEEPFSIALTLRESLGPAFPRWDVRILASDVDTDTLRIASEGVYPRDRLGGVVEQFGNRWFTRCDGGRAEKARFRSEIREMIAFRHINLMEDPWPIRTRFDVIFCRNVLIYFDHAGQRRVLERLLGYLKPNGLLFLGHSESLHGRFSGMRHIQDTVYQRVGEPRPLGPEGTP